MKTLSLFLILFFSTGVFANQFGSWRPIDDVKNSPAFWNKSQCENKTGKACDFALDPRRVMAGQVDDLDSPKYTKEDLSACSGLENCQTNLAGKDCTAHGEGAFGVINAELTEAYCAKPNGFNQKPGLVDDPAGIAQADADDAAKAAKDASESLIDAVIKRQDCGRRVLAVMAIQNEPKGLSVGQKKTLINTYAEIKSLLELGSLAEAKTEVEAATPDGVLVTDADKTALIAKIDECLL